MSMRKDLIGELLGCEPESLLNLVGKKDKKGVKDWEARAEKGEIMRIM